jgi:hypothetical protein
MRQPRFFFAVSAHVANCAACSALALPARWACHTGMNSLAWVSRTTKLPKHRAIHFGVHVDAGLFGQTLRHILFFKIGAVAIFLRHGVLGFGGFGSRLSVAGRASREQEGAE